MKRNTFDPVAIEVIYTKVAPVKEMCVFMVADKILWAIIKPDLENFREFSEVNLRSVLQERFDNAAESIPRHQRLEGFTIILEDLPRTFFGELKRSQVKYIYEPRVIAGLEGALPTSGKHSSEDLLLMQSKIGIAILKCLQKGRGIKRTIKLEDSLELDLGIDSLGRLELASCLEEAFGVSINNEVVSKAFIVRDLILRITETLNDAQDIPLEDQGVMFEPDYWKAHLSVPPQKENLELLELGTGYFAWLFRFIVTAMDCLVMKLFFNIKGEGAKNVPQEGPYIIFGNHTSFLDGPAIAACLPRRPVFQLFYFVFGPYFFRPFEKSYVLRNLIKMGRFIPFDFSTHFLEALRSSYYVLQHNKGLCFFPEGLRSSIGEIGEFKKGFGVLAKVTGAKLVPVAIEGAHEAWASTAKYPQCRPIRVKFGKPLLVDDLENQGLAMGARNSYEAICVAARKALIDLKNG